MTGQQTTKTVIRMLWPWNDEKEERWLAEQERSGWHLKAVRGFGYTFEKASPSDVAYRMDFGPQVRKDMDEYLGLFQDSGWEHVGNRGQWHYFRHGVVDGQVPEIYTDPASRVTKYQRVMAMLGVLLFIRRDPTWRSPWRFPGRGCRGSRLLGDPCTYRRESGSIRPPGLWKAPVTRRGPFVPPSR